MTGASAVTWTVPLTPWSDNPTSSVVARPTSTTTASLEKGAKPDTFTVTVYVPGSRLVTLKPPLSSVVALASLLVPLFFAVMVAPATTSLLGFVTVPAMPPVTVPWASAAAQNAATSREAKQKRRVLVITGELLRKVRFVETIVRASHRALS